MKYPMNRPRRAGRVQEPIRGGAPDKRRAWIAQDQRVDLALTSSTSPNEPSLNLHKRRSNQ